MKIILITTILFLSMHIMGQEYHENILENKTYIERIAQFKQNPLEKGQVIFLGNSLTQGGKWNEYFSDQNPANRGIAGDNTLGMLGRLHEIIEAKPSKLFIMAGINDISLNRPTQKIMNGIKSIVYQMREGSPSTVIYMQSLLPINNDAKRYKRMLNKEKQVEKLNKEIKKFCKSENIIFINLYPSFLESKRKMNAKYTTDGLHLNEDGYAIWADQIKKYMNN